MTGEYTEVPVSKSVYEMPVDILMKRDVTKSNGPGPHLSSDGKGTANSTLSLNGGNNAGSRGPKNRGTNAGGKDAGNTESIDVSKGDASEAADNPIGHGEGIGERSPVASE